MFSMPECMKKGETDRLNTDTDEDEKQNYGPPPRKKARWKGLDDDDFVENLPRSDLIETTKNTKRLFSPLTSRSVNIK